MEKNILIQKRVKLLLKKQKQKNLEKEGTNQNKKMETITTLLESIDPNITYGLLGAAAARAVLGKRKAKKAVKKVKKVRKSITKATLKGVAGALIGRRRKKAKAKAKATKSQNQAKYQAARAAYKKRGTSNVKRSTKAKGGR